MRIGYTTTTGGAISTPVEGGSRATPPRVDGVTRLVHLVHAVALASVSAWRQGFVREVGVRFVWRADVCTHRTTPRPSGLEPMDWDVTDVSDHAPGFASPRLDSRSAVSSSGLRTMEAPDHPRHMRGQRGDVVGMWFIPGYFYARIVFLLSSGFQVKARNYLVHYYPRG